MARRKSEEPVDLTELNARAAAAGAAATTAEARSAVAAADPPADKSA